MKYRSRYKWAKKLARMEAPQANAKLVAKNTIVLYFRMLVVMAVGLFTGRIFLQALGVNDYGLQSVAGAVIGMFTFMNGSLATASSRFLTVELGKGTIGSAKRTFSTILTVHFILACIFVVVLETVGLVVLESKLNIDPSRIFAVKWLYHCSVISVFLGVTQVPYGAVIVAHERMGAFAWMSIYDVVVKLLVAFAVMYYQGDKLILNGTLWFISGTSTMMFYRWYCIRNFSEARYRGVFDRNLIKPVFSFAGWQIFSQAMWMLTGQGMTLLNQRFFGPALIAAISIGDNVHGRVWAFVDSFRVASNPQVVKLYAAKKFAESKQVLINSTHLSAYLLLLLGVPVVFYAKEALYIWLGNSMPKLSVEFVQIILAGSFFGVFEASFYQVFYAAGRIRENAIVNFCLGMVLLIIAFVVVRLTMNPFTTSILYCIHRFLQGMIVKPLLAWLLNGYELKDLKKVYAKPLLALVLSVVFASGVKMMMPDGILWAVPSCLIIIGVISIALYAWFLPIDVQARLINRARRMPIVRHIVVPLLLFLNREKIGQLDEDKSCLG